MGLLPTRRDRRVFISWWRYTSRPLSLALAMDAENYFFAQGAKWGLLKYFPRAICCFWMLVRRRPALVFVSNPPVLAPMVVWFYCRLFNARYCIDSHTAAFDRPRWARLMPFQTFFAKHAVWNAVTNLELKEQIDENWADVVVVEDVPFDMPRGEFALDASRFNVAVVTSFDEDEPILEILEAARRLPETRFYMTGNEKRATPKMHAARPENVTFTGFISNEAYGGLLYGASAVLVLTTNDFTMQRGGSEAITAGKPLITTDFAVLRRIFYQGTVHVENTPEAIAAGIQQVQDDYDRFQKEIIEMRTKRDAKWLALRQELEEKLQQ